MDHCVQVPNIWSKQYGFYLGTCRSPSRHIALGTYLVWRTMGVLMGNLKVHLEFIARNIADSNTLT